MLHRTRNKRRTVHGASPNTAAQLIGGALGNKHGRYHTPNFRMVLPSKMRELVDQGLFVADESAEGGYRITELGRQKLVELEKA